MDSELTSEDLSLKSALSLYSERVSAIAAGSEGIVVLVGSTIGTIALLFFRAIVCSADRQTAYAEQ